MLNLIKKIVGTKNDREIKRIRPYVDEINDLEPDYQGLSDAELKARTDQFKARLTEATASLKERARRSAQPRARARNRSDAKRSRPNAEELDKQVREKEAEILEELLPEAFAAVREASRRTIGLRHFDVQLIGGVVLHEGKICRDENRRRQDSGGDLAALLKCLDRARRPLDHRQ